MKKIILVMTMMLAMSVAARDRLYIENFTITPGEPVDVYIYLDNDTTYSTFQTDLFLPEGLEIEMEDDEYFIDPVYSRLPSRTHSVSASLMPDGAIRILVLSQGVKPILGNSGAVLVMSVIATQEVTNGLVELRNSKAVEENGQKHYLDDCQAYANPGPTTVLATSIALDQETATLTEGQTLQLAATVLPDDATDKSVTWSTSNAAVATVDANGLVTAVAQGTATITATTNDGSELSASCQMTVKKPALSGDVNLDGTVDVTDVNIVVNIILGKDQAAYYDGRADVSGDDAVDVTDVNQVVNIILGKE